MTAPLSKKWYEQNIREDDPEVSAGIPDAFLKKSPASNQPGVHPSTDIELQNAADHRAAEPKCEEPE